MDENKQERSLVEAVKHAEGKYGGFCFGDHQPDGVHVHNPLPAGTVYPNGATAALLPTFDTEGTYGNGTGDMALEIANYERICERLKQNEIPATFTVVGQMAEKQGPEFVEWMLDAGCEVATHGYVHEMNARYGGDRIYGGHYKLKENLEQVRDGVAAINAIRPNTVRGVRMPYGHFNEFSYDAMEQIGLDWASNVGRDDFLVPERGYGGAPFQMKLGEKLYPIVEIPLDSETYDWSIWIASEVTNGERVNAVRKYCRQREIDFVRTPAGGVGVWRRRMLDTIEAKSVFTLLCHPINLAVKSDRWNDPVEEFLLPVIDILEEFHKQGEAWVCTCAQMTDFYWEKMRERIGTADTTPSA